MSSRRKSSNPCMVRVEQPEEKKEDPQEVTHTQREESETSESAGKSPEPLRGGLQSPDRQVENRNPEPAEQEEPEEQEEQEEQEERQRGEEKDREEPETQKKRSRGYECKYCPLVTPNLNEFKEHVDCSHPNVILNPLYHCAACSFHTNKFDSLSEHNHRRHPGETNFKFKRIAVNSQTVLEQTIGGKESSPECERPPAAATTTCPPPPVSSTTVKTPAALQSLFRGGDSIQKEQITAVNINGTVIIPEPRALHGLAHVAPVLQRPPNFNSVPKIAVPLNTTKYNPSLDDNLTLIASFNKFPYPTHAELSWLTAASKHPEEQIKVWFTTQRLKQGITWSPEEVEEARKKMFNGSIPPAHHTFTVPPSQTCQQPSGEQPGHARTSAPSALAHALKRPLPSHLTAASGPESKRPVMAVAPHSGDAKDKILMAPPPPPPPQKERHTMAPPPVPPEMKRPVAAPPGPAAAEMTGPSAAVPLMPLSSSCQGKILSALGSPKTKPLVSLPSIVFPESLTRPLIVPPPIFAPPFKNAMFIPRAGPKDKGPNATSLPAADLNLPTSPPPVHSPLRRPTIIQSLRPAAKAPSQLQGFQKLKEQQGVELKSSYPRGDKVVSPLSEANGTSRYDGKWSQDHGTLHPDGGQAPSGLKPEFHQKSSAVLTQFPLLERMKGKSAKQLKILEEKFLRNSFPSHGDVDHLAGATRLSHQEIESWFAERRALRDNLEQALLNSMGSKRGGVAEKHLHLHTLQLNGIHKPRSGGGGGQLKSPPPHLPPAALNHCPVPPEGRRPPQALLKDELAPTRWPSPEEFSHLEGRTGLMRAELARWFTDTRLQGGAELTELFQGGDANRWSTAGSPDDTPTGAAQRCQDNGSKVLEVELGWLMDPRGPRGARQPHDEVLQDRVNRLRQQSATKLKSGGGVRDVFGSWLEDGRPRRGRDLLLDRDRKMADDASGRLTG